MISDDLVIITQHGKAYAKMPGLSVFCVGCFDGEWKSEVMQDAHWSGNSVRLPNVGYLQQVVRLWVQTAEDLKKFIIVVGTIKTPQNWK